MIPNPNYATKDEKPTSDSRKDTEEKVSTAQPGIVIDTDINSLMDECHKLYEDYLKKHKKMVTASSDLKMVTLSLTRKVRELRKLSPKVAEMFSPESNFDEQN